MNKHTLRKLFFMILLVLITFVTIRNLIIEGFKLELLEVNQLSNIPIDNDNHGTEAKGSSTLDFVSNCTGKPQERRRLAEIGNKAIKEQWVRMMECIEEREEKLVGVYALHVSKSGGTSLCNLFKDEHCFVPPIEKPEANCFVSKYKKFGVSLGPQWLRKKYSEQLGLPQWMSYDETAVPSSSCDTLRKYLEVTGQKVAMSENWLPEGGTLCQNQFNNIVVVRNPIHRILSHYRHIFHACMSNKVEDKHIQKCSSMLHGNIFNQDGRNYFNLTEMTKTFDIITDNYYMRSLNDQIIYKQPLGMNGNGEEYFRKAIQNLQSFDWILLLNNGNLNEEKTSREIIIRNGLGLKKDFGSSRRKKKSSIFLLEKDIKALQKLNKYDIKIWNEAKRLHKLDIVSIRKYFEYEIIRGRKSSFNDEECCGWVCSKAYSLG